MKCIIINLANKSTVKIKTLIKALKKGLFLEAFCLSINFTISFTSQLGGQAF